MSKAAADSRLSKDPDSSDDLDTAQRPKVDLFVMILKNRRSIN